MIYPINDLNITPIPYSTAIKVYFFEKNKSLNSRFTNKNITITMISNDYKDIYFYFNLNGLNIIIGSPTKVLSYFKELDYKTRLFYVTDFLTINK